MLWGKGRQKGQMSQNPPPTTPPPNLSSIQSLPAPASMVGGGGNCFVIHMLCSSAVLSYVLGKAMQRGRGDGEDV